MEPFDLSTAAWLGAGAILLAGLGARMARRRRPAAAAAALAAGQGAPVPAAAPSGAAPEALFRRLDLRMEAIEGAQAGLAARLESGGPEALQAMAGQILGLVRDKDASLETALAGLDQLRARIRVVEQMGAPAEARSLLDGLVARLDGLEAAQARGAAATEARLAAFAAAENPFTEISDQLTRLYAQKDAAVETVFSRLAPLEAKLAELEGAQASRDPAAALARFGERLEALQSRVAGIEGAENPFTEISDQLTRLYAQKDAAVETVFSRLAPLEAKLAELEGAQASRDPAAALARFGERLEALQSRVAGIEGAENPFTEISDQLTRLYAQKDAAVETVFSRLAPLEAKLAELEGAQASRDPAAALARFGERLEALQSRVAGIEGAENPFTEISDQLTRLYAQKDAATETVFSRLAPLEAKLAELEGAQASRDPAAALARIGERLEALQSRVAGIEGAENPFTEISDQLTRLYAQKDAAVETVLSRLAPLEAKLAELEGAQASRDPAAALARIGERLEALQSRVAGIEGAENPFTEISDQLTRLYAQKDAATETVFSRLAPLEAKLAELEGAQASRDPAAALARIGERLEALQSRVAGIEGAENPFTEISDQLTRLYAQKDAAVETVFSRLAPLEAKLAELEGAQASRDPAAALARFGERLEALQSRVAGIEGAENPFTEISDQLTRLYAQKDAAVETVFSRLAPLEAKLAELEGAQASRDPAAALDRIGERIEAARGAAAAAAADLGARVAGLEGAARPMAEISERVARLAAAAAEFEARVAPLETRLAALEAEEDGAEAARAEAQAIAAQLIAARTVAEETRLFASRITLLEASLPRLSHAQALMMQALERQAAPAGLALAPLPDAAPQPVPAAALPGPAPAAPWDLPRVVSVHRG